MVNHSPFGYSFSFATQPIIDPCYRTIFAHEFLVRGVSGEGASVIFRKMTDKDKVDFDVAMHRMAVDYAVDCGMRENIALNVFPSTEKVLFECIDKLSQYSMERGLDPNRIIIEISEDQRVADFYTIFEVFRHARALGFKIAIDDFGSGFTSLRMLSEFKPDIIKLDRSLLQGIATSCAKKRIYHNVVRLCEELGITSVCEGCELDEEFQSVFRSGVNLHQGYLFAAPKFKGHYTPEEVSWL